MTLAETEKMAALLREDVIRMLLQAGSGHSAGPLGMADVFAALYFKILRHKPSDPDWEDRDRLILSNGHICPIRYAAMARAGYFDLEELMTLRQFGSRLQGHPERTKLPGVETTSGPLGSGLSQASGIAYAWKMDGHKRRRVYCVTSDGEHEEGNTWEAILFASKYKLSNLTVIVDRNNIQIDGPTERVMPLEPLPAKYESFGWHVTQVDGHNVEAIIDACEEARAVSTGPTVIIAHTIPGKGVEFMEYDYTWHGKAPGKDEARKALKELRSLGGRISGEHD
jgi:transketolase